MKIESTTVTKLILSGIPNRDTVAVYVENYEPGAGKITITSAGNSWTASWWHMGEQHTMESFFRKAGEHYLAGKLKVGIPDAIDDDDVEALIPLLKNEIIKQRREGDITHERARDLWGDACSLGFWGEHFDICCEVFGDEWWMCIPRRPNPEYLQLLEVIGSVKHAFAQMAASPEDQLSTT